MATYSNNTTIKFVTQFQILNTTSSSASSYTVPSGHFAILGNAEAVGNGAGGLGIVTVNGVVLLSEPSTTRKYHGGDVHVGEGGVISCSNGTGSCESKAQGAVFKNTP